MEEEFIFKTTSSPLDERDWSAEAIYDDKNDLPKKLDLRGNIPPLRNQGNLGTCAAQTAAAMKEWQENKNINFKSHMSPMFVYNNRINQDNEGMYGRDVMRILKDLGCCKEFTYPYRTTHSIDDKVLEEAANCKIKGYARVHTINTLKRALLKNGPCYISFPVYNNGKRMWIAKRSEKQKGGHAMTVVGYTKEGFIIRNSWGILWGDQGHCVYPYDDWGSHYEIWTTIDDESSQPFDKKWSWRDFIFGCIF